MSYVVLCNTGSDSLSKIDTENLKVQNLYLSTGEKPFGPHGLSLYREKILVTNNYNNSISVINLQEFKEENNLYIGAHPNDITVYNNIAYVTCGESNSLIVYDLLNERINFEIPTGRLPHSIALFSEKELAFISNMGEDNLSVIDCKNNKELKRIKVGENPIKISISNNKKYLYACTSYIGNDKNGVVSIISLDTLMLIDEIEVGLSPVDLFEDNDYLYVSNLCDGSISIVNLKEFKQENKINVEGMPKGIVKSKKYIFIGDYLNSNLCVLNVKNKLVKRISTGIEPNSIILINN